MGTNDADSNSKSSLIPMSSTSLAFVNQIAPRSERRRELQDRLSQAFVMFEIAVLIVTHNASYMKR